MKYSIQEMDVLSIVTILGSIMIKQRLDQLMIYRKLMVWLILLLTFFSIELAAIEKKSMSFLPPQLRIAIASDLMPYSFVDDKGQAKGLLVDYWRLWSKKPITLLCLYRQLGQARSIYLKQNKRIFMLGYLS